MEVLVNFTTGLGSVTDPNLAGPLAGHEPVGVGDYGTCYGKLLYIYARQGVGR